MSRRFFLVTLASLFIGSSAVAQQSTSTFEILAAGGTNGAGANPHGGLVLGPDGNYYGTASAGGAFGTGTIFKLTPDGILTGLASFPYEQGIPSEALTVGSDGHLYGTTQGASRSSPPGQDIAFRVTLDGQLTTLAPFARTRPGSVEPQRLVEAADGHLYGTTTFGGAEDEGSIFRLTKDGTLTTLMSFTDYPSHGAWPHGGLIEGSNGDLYGTANRGGAFGGGTVFRISKGGDFATIANFELTAATGHAPEAELIEAPDGNFYGVTFSGTSSYRGAVFRMTPAGALSGIAPLPETSVLAPGPLALGLDGNFYATTTDHFYRVSTSGELTVLVDFTAELKGRTAQGPLLRLPDGDFLGTTFSGGIIGQNANGTVHRLSPNGGATTVVAFPRVVVGGFRSELSEGADGQLYGTAYGNSGSTSPRPGVFKVDKSGNWTPLNVFPSASRFTSEVRVSRGVAAANGDLFGTVSEGGRSTGVPPGSNIGPSGYIYRLRPNGTISIVYQFMGTRSGSPNEKGEAPTGALTPGPDAHLYGTTAAGGAEARGVFFKVDVDGNLTALASFNAASGLAPLGDLVFSDGLFYGVTALGGDHNAGTFFSVTPQGQITRIMSLPPGRPLGNQGRLILASDRNFYGVFATGGANGMGSVFRLTKGGVLSTFASMDANTGQNSRGVMQASDGNFYGVTLGSDSPGTIFRVEPSGVVTVVARFSDEKGTLPLANLMQATDGHLYGTTAAGGPARAGVVYRLKVLPPKQLLNISTRLRVLTDENVLIGGFIVAGNQPKKVIVRALGQSLQERGVSGALANPTLELRGSGGSLIAANDNWKTTQRAEIEASGVPPASDLESAIVATLQPGDYTATVSGVNSSTGVGLVEVYDLDQGADARMANISTRGFVATGEDVMIAGLIAGSGSSNAKAILRALGPSLQASGVKNALANPTLDIRDGNGNQLEANDNWKDDPAQAAEIQASGLAPQDDLEAAVAIFPPAGAITAIVRGKADTTGVALIEVYDVQ